ncbi:MAG: hypothetical protein FWC71_02640 [Defluviitaleaceae bacterium]|nr:hypothetical protein [Defluviitaleaceae bacterium]
MNWRDVILLIAGIFLAGGAIFFLTGAIVTFRGRSQLFLFGREFSANPELFNERKYLRYGACMYLIFGTYAAILAICTFTGMHVFELVMLPIGLFGLAFSYPEYSRRFRKDPSAPIEVHYTDYSKWQQPLEKANDEKIRKRGVLIAGTLLAAPLIFMLIVILVT